MARAQLPTRRRVQLPQLALLLPWIGIAVVSFRPVSDNSFLWHITAGHLQRSTGEVLTTDPFSFTMAGQAWRTQSWLAELLYSRLAESFGIGFTGFMLLLAGSLTAVAVGSYVFSKSGSATVTATLLLLTSLLFMAAQVPRPVLFSYPLFVLLVIVWERESLRWTVPFLMWTWASVHGSFAVGVIFMAAMVMWKRDWRAWLYLGVGGLATLLTAHGWGVVSILSDFLVSRPYLALMTEWRTPDFLSLTSMPFLVGIFLLVYGSMRSRLDPRALWLIVPFVVLGVSATRSVATAWIGLLPATAAALGNVAWRFGRGFPLPVAITCWVFIIVLPGWFAESVDVDTERFPVVASSHLADVRTFHDDVAGGYFIFEERFSAGVFIDDRAELYRGRIREFIEVRSGREPWGEVFQRDGIEQAILKANEPLVSDLLASGWATVYEDASYVVMRP